ncbi:signal recognition particle receptor subunit alpha homolog [Topomyia yanbarensis]|uniref:signal recognition particle receptor subunit alpha homolog n=1 Tax=Topomyia yanbarensis TaxID=2498891 RepID=UPI00273C3E0A|nr:signal recognition particle receptor subunit alpha homolog [Topomyia yanbarensis]XP_058831560.1 signal recognition particle receptor subunit alpha homolog [Topomyia yanbarensis]XP_058831561.1 signal recognition particle receptor subunit alpha homolog [Topomyia yanbarensis]
MLDLFTIFTKGGIVLWCFRGTNQLFAPPVNALIRSVILQERSGIYDHDGLSLQYKLDNEFELIFVVAFQKILQLSYIDKFLSDVHLEFRDKYKNDLRVENRNYTSYQFQDEFTRILDQAEKWGKLQATLPKQMRSYEESHKSKKTVSSMIERKGEEKPVTGGKKSVKIVENKKQQEENIPPVQLNGTNDDLIMENRKRLMGKMNKKNKGDKPKSPKSPPQKSGKQMRVWDLGGNVKDLPNLDRCKDKPEDIRSDFTPSNEMIGTMKGGIQDLEVESDDDYSEEEDDEVQQYASRPSVPTTKKTGGMLSLFKGLVGSKNLTRSDMQSALDKLRDHLISKNVAADISQKLCESVAVKLEGKVLGTFDTITATVKNTLTDALVQILSPKRRVDILRDCLEAKKNRRPYVMSFCGVNGVGKSTNLAKICFWLIENNLNVLIAACDTFRAGAVEQLRTHTRHLNALHPAEKHAGREMVQLYEKGYGKDAAGIAMEAIRYAKDVAVDVVLIDTAGRMQDNEPLMRALAKLIKVNEPDLVLFVGEALVGNEAVDQLVKFNQALADYSANDNPHIIDGIVLTKFDTIDDKVGAAISMTYITGQPIVFVGTGQTYTDLKKLNAKAVVHALMK